MANESISVLKSKEYSPPRPGWTRTYKLLGLRIDEVTGKLVCPNSRKISNKFLVNDKKGDQDNVKSFVYVSHQDPSVSSDSIPASQRGKIVFLHNAMGRIHISGDNPEQFEMDKALFFHQQNKSNVGKPWHIKPKSGLYVFELVDPKAKAVVNINQVERRNDSENIIKEMKVPVMRDTYELLFKQDSEGFSEKEIRSHLYDYVQKDDNAQNFLVLSQSEQMKNKVIVRNAIEQKFIEASIGGTSYVWSKGKELICNKLPRISLQDSLLKFLVTDDGKDIFKTLKDLTEAKN